MKSILLRSVALFGALLCGLCGQRANALPAIFHATESAGPGDVIGIQGDSFGNSPQVWMLHVTGTEASLTPAKQLTVLSGTGSLNATGSNSYVSALIPVTETPGLYVVWVSSDGGATFGPGAYVNQAMPWNADDLCGSAVDPNRQFHIYGRNLRFSGTGTPTVSFVSGTTSLAATVNSGTDPYILSVKSPSGVTGGVNYTLNVSNGLGGSYGIVAGPTLTGTITSGTDPFGLGVPWGADFANYPSRTYTVPFVSSTTDMTSAIQTAINAVSGSGGGVVALQSGTYKLSPGTAGGAYSFLAMKSNVVIQGAGMDQTVLLMSGTSTSDPIGYHFGLYDNGATVIDAGLSNLTLYNTTTGGSSNLSFPHANHDKFFAVQTRFKADAANNVVYSGSQLVMNNCVVASGTGAWVMSGTTLVNDAGSPGSVSGVVNAVFKNNFFQYYNGRVWLQNGGIGMLILSNTFSRVAYGTWLGETGALDVQQSQDTVVLGNALQKDPTLSGTYNFDQNNDGETILNQTGHNNYPCHGNVSSATSTTLTDTTKNWTNNYAAPDDNQMYYVSIVSGPGTGQIRKVISNTTTTLTVDSSWQVTPTASSVYSVNHIESLRHLVKDNTLTGGVQGIMYYSVSIKDTVIVNNTLTDNGGIWLRSDYRPPTTNRFQVQMDSVVSNNVVTRTLSNPYSFTDSYAYILDTLFLTGTDHAPGTLAYCMEFRGNTITAAVPSQKSGLAGEGFGMTALAQNMSSPVADGTTVMAIGTIFQGNTAVSCSNAFHLCTGDCYSTMWGNIVNGTGATLLYDGTGSGISHGSVANTSVCNAVTPGIMEDDVDAIAGAKRSLGTTGSMTIQSGYPFTASSGSYLDAYTAAGTTGRPVIATYTPASSANSWAAVTGTTVAAGITYTTLNGAFDVFVCPNSVDSTSGWFRPLDMTTISGSSGMRLIFNNCGNGVQLEITTGASLGLGSTPGSFTTNNTWSLPGAITAIPNPFTVGSVTHLGITFNTNALTGQITMKVFGVSGTGTINTGSNTNLLATQSFYASEAVIGLNPLPNGPWSMTQPSSSTVNTSVDYDTVRVYMSDPGTFPGL